MMKATLPRKLSNHDRPSCQVRTRDGQKHLITWVRFLANLPLAMLVQNDNIHIYPTKKKRTTSIFPLSSPFNTKMFIVMKYLFLITSFQNLSVA